MPMKMMLKVTILKLNLKVGKVMHIQFGVGTAENPVSYTHLDVYKRQM